MINMWLLVILVLSLIIILATGLYRVLYPPYHDIVRKIPGPKGHPVIGIGLEIMRLTQPDFSKWFWSIIEKFGSPMAIPFGPRYNVVLSKADHVEILLKSSTNITKSADYDFILDWLGTGLLISTGSKWHKRRKLLTPAFHFQILKDFMPIFNEQADILVEILNKKVNQVGNEAFDICKYITNCTLDIICETAMGKQIHAQKEDSFYTNSLNKFVLLMSHRFRNVHMWPDIIYFRTADGNQFQQQIDNLHSFTKKVIRERDSSRRMTRKDDSSTGNQDSFGKRKQRLAFLDLLLEMKDKGELNYEDIREETDTFMFEGHDTTATGTMWALYCISRHPDVQQRLYEEIQDVVGSDSTTHITPDHIANLKYLECVLKESQRIFPSVPFVGRAVTESFEAGGYTVPVGVICNISIYSLHHDPEVFPDPFKFVPERFSSENSVGRHPFAFVPFSAGPRNCIGQKFALMEEKVIIVHILRAFEMKTKQVPEDTLPSIELVLRPAGGIWLKLTPRKGL